MPLRDILHNPDIAHYVLGWPRAGDIGVVAADGDPVGAAWLRFFAPTDPGFGFVADTIPELSIGVVRPRRGQGVGGRLLDALLTAAGAAGIDAVSLSVERDNPARRLYERLGFRPVGAVGGSMTMLLRLGHSGALDYDPPPVPSAPMA